MNRRFAVTLAAILLAQAGTAGRLEGQTALRVTPVVGATLFLSEPPSPFILERPEGGDLEITEGRFRDAVTVGALLGVHFTPRWEIETLLAFVPSKLQAEGGLPAGSIDATSYLYGANVNYHFPLDVTVGPYVSLGIGGEAWDYGIPGAGLHNQLMLQAGAGIDLPITEYFSLRLDARDGVTRFDSGIPDTDARTMHHLMTNVGLTFVMPRE